LIRPATPADIEDIVSFAAVAIPDTYVPLLGEPNSAELLGQWWSRDPLAVDIDCDTVVVTVPDPQLVPHSAAAIEPIIGYIHVARWNDEPVMWKLYVAPSHRSAGHGAALINAAIAHWGPTRRRC
jgi:GNAT superfamily N-acetyltransferase